MKKLTVAFGILSIAILSGCVKEMNPHNPSVGDEQMQANSSNISALNTYNEFVHGELLIKFKPGASETGRANALARISGKIKEHVIHGSMKQNSNDGFYVVNIPNGVQEAIERIKALADVEYAEPNYIYQIPENIMADYEVNDPYYAAPDNLWGMMGELTTAPYQNKYASRAAEAWQDIQPDGTWGPNKQIGLRNVYVAVIDQGVDDDNPDLIHQDGTKQVVTSLGRDFVSNDWDPDPIHGSEDHGTHVAGTIGAIGNNAKGVSGVCWNVSIISVRFLNDRGSGTAANAAKAINYITDLKLGLVSGKPKVNNIIATNNSWGGLSSTAISDAIARANTNGILFIAAAGNSNRNNDTYAFYPANYTHSNIISVASIQPNGGKSSFSNWGKTSVDLAAPGSYIWSTVPFGCFSDDDKDGVNNGIGWMSGTSMATPHVTGAAALWVAANDADGNGFLDADIADLTKPIKADDGTVTSYEKLYVKDTRITDEMVKNMIIKSARATISFSDICVSGGRLDVRRLIKNDTRITDKD